MRRRTIAIAVAVVLALAAAGLVVWYVSSLRHETTTAEQTQTVLVATADIPERTTGEALIEKGLVERKQVVVSSVTPGALVSEMSLQGKVTIIPIAKGQQVLQNVLGLPEEQSLSYQIKQGMRALTLPIDRNVAVGGLIKDGDRVDVIATFKGEDFSSVLFPASAVLAPAEAERIKLLTGLDLTTTYSPVSRVVLQQVQVLAVDNLVDTTNKNATGVFTSGNNPQGVPELPVIVLMVTPQEAEKLVFAQEFGKIWFTLVPAQDTTQVQTGGQSMFNVLSSGQ